MPFEKISNTAIFKVVNILIAFLLTGGFFIAGQNVMETFSVARMASLNNLTPQPMDYFWELNIHQAPLDKNKLHLYTDYYEQLLRSFPDLWDIYGILGYCYHSLNDDPKAIKYLEIAVKNYPDYFWNYYNLAVLYIHESRDQEASDLLQKALKLNPAVSLRRMISSQHGYWPLLASNEREVVTGTSDHLKDFYKLSTILEYILIQAGDSPEGQQAIKKLHLELYAF